MKIKVLMEEIFTGKKVRFSEETVLSGRYKNNKVIVVEDLETHHKFIIFRSLTNFIRFQRWVGKTARADIAPIKNRRVEVDSGKLHLIRLSTVVEVDKAQRDKDNRGLDWENNYGMSTTWEPEDAPDMRQGHAGTE